MKRVVTGHDKDGKAVFIKVGEPEHVVKGLGILWKELWATFPGCKVPADTSDEPSKRDKWKSVFPEPGETRIRVLEMDPNPDPEVCTVEEIDRLGKELPGLYEHMETDVPGMHTTDSIDYIIILSGKVALELDDGKTVDLEPGDVIIQNGTRHAWRYKEKCTMLCVLIGAERSK